MKVEKGIPIPARFPFEQMQVGDSFVVPMEITRYAVSVAAHRYGKKHGVKFTVRKYKDGTYRCWRTA
jgi:hypothetical protein